MTDRIDPAGTRHNEHSEPERSQREGDLARLERGVRKLVEQLEAAQSRNQQLERDLKARESRLHELEAEILSANQRRQDVVKRIDDLVAWIDRATSSDGTAFDLESEPAQAQAGSGNA